MMIAYLLAFILMCSILLSFCLLQAINDVLLGITQASLSGYLNRKHTTCKDGGDMVPNQDNLPKNIRLRVSFKVATFKNFVLI